MHPASRAVIGRTAAATPGHRTGAAVPPASSEQTTTLSAKALSLVTDILKAALTGGNRSTSPNIPSITVGIPLPGAACPCSTPVSSGCATLAPIVSRSQLEPLQTHTEPSLPVDPCLGRRRPITLLIIKLVSLAPKQVSHSHFTHPQASSAGTVRVCGTLGGSRSAS